MTKILLALGSFFLAHSLFAQAPNPVRDFKLPPIPEVSPIKPPGSVPMADPKTFPEAKEDFPMYSGPFQPTWESIAKNYPGDPEWLREAKFGFWVHFGPQASGQSGDWYARRMYLEGQPAYKNHLRDFGHPSEFGYKDILRNWNPTKLDPAAYVKLYKEAGARFLFVQGVHHDNYDMWNSKYQPWNSVNIGPKRDLLGEWAKALKQEKMRFGVTFHHEYTWWWYESAFRSDTEGPKAGVPYDGNLTLADGKGKWWEGYDPRRLYGINLREYKGADIFPNTPIPGIFINHLAYDHWYVTQWAMRIQDVVEKYDPDFIYTDGNDTQPFTGYKSSAGYKSDGMQRVMASYYNRTLKTRGKVDTFSIVKFHPPANGIVNTAEGSFPGNVKIDQPWIGENAVGDWFYVPNIKYSSAAVVRCLLEYVSRDGNYAVNIPMAPDGSLDPDCVVMLREIGDWMKINGGGIYGSSAWVKFGEGADGKINVLPGGMLGARQANFKFGPQDFRFTVGKDAALYAYALDLPAPGATVAVASLGTTANLLTSPVKSVTLLGQAGTLPWKQTPEGLQITYPATATAAKIAAVFRIECAKPVLTARQTAGKR